VVVYNDSLSRDKAVEGDPEVDAQQCTIKSM